MKKDIGQGNAEMIFSEANKDHQDGKLTAKYTKYANTNKTIRIRIKIMIRKRMLRACRLAMGALLAGVVEVCGAAGWVNISDPLVATVTNTGAAIPWPGNTAGVAVDRTSGILYVDVCNVGLWQSTDHGQSFHHVAEGQISGRCEFGYALNCDPAGRRMACLMLDGRCGMTLDCGRTWPPFAPMGF